MSSFQWRELNSWVAVQALSLLLDPKKWCNKHTILARQTPTVQAGLQVEIWGGWGLMEAVPKLCPTYINCADILWHRKTKRNFWNIHVLQNPFLSTSSQNELINTTFVHWRISKLILDFHLESRDISEFGSWLFLHLTVSLTHSLSVKKQQKNQHVSRYLVKKSFADFDGSKLENMVP